jgi:magnesium transporter
MIAVFVHRNGRTEVVPALDPAWIGPGANDSVWVDLSAPTEEELGILTEVFHFHQMAVEDAIAERHDPKVEVYDGYFHLILHGIDYHRSKEAFATHDTDFFLGPNYLVTIHDGKTRSVAAVRDICGRTDHILGEGPGALMHRIVDQMVSNYQPEVDELEEWLDELEADVFDRPRNQLVREILQAKRDISSLRRIAGPQKNALNQLARREVPLITQELAHRFRDVFDDLVRLESEALMFQDRATGILEAHVSSVSNRLNEVMKVLTVITVIFMPLTLVAGIYGMNMKLPLVATDQEPQPFWWIVGGMVVTVLLMLAFFRRRGWI